jgi:hypothetical protein
MQFILRKGAVPTIDSVSSEREEILTERDKRQGSLVYSLWINRHISYFVRRYMYMGRDKRQVILVYSLWINSYFVRRYMYMGNANGYESHLYDNLIFK